MVGYKYHLCMFIISITMNIFLIWLILTKSPKKLGTYKYFMLYFCCYAVLFSSLDFIVQPKIFIGNRTFVIGSICSSITPSKMLSLVCILCGSFGSTISIFVIHFMFRYFALERRGRLHYFQGPGHLTFWFLLPFLPGSFWSFMTYRFLKPNDSTISIVLELIQPLTMTNYSYISSTYFLQTGELNIPQFLTMFILMGLMVISITLVGYFAVGSYRLINEILEVGESDYSRNLQKQLFLALVCQAIIPSLLMYMPVGSLCILPFFNVTIPVLPTLVTTTYALYPAIDTLPIIIIVDSYRNALVKPLISTFQSNQQITPDHS